MNHLKIYIQRAPWHRGYDVHLAKKLESGEIAVAKPIEWRVATDHELNIESPSMLRLDTDDAQLFMDELWNAGLRPTEGTGSAGAMAAVQAHLKDMQRLVFKERK